MPARDLLQRLRPASARASPRHRARTPNEADAIRQSGLFDAVWYAERNPAAAAYPDPVAHYLAAGAAQDRAPHPLFSTGWYRDSNPGLAASGLTPLGHFILRGEAAGASPSPLFDPAWYRAQDPALHHRTTGLFLHFLQQGAVRGLSPHPAFDPAWYRAGRPDMAADVNPLTHFFVLGAEEATSPSPFFDLAWYEVHYADAIRRGVNPLEDFLRWGAAAGRQPHPDIDLAAYQAAHPDCPRDPAAAFRHLITHETAAAFFQPRADTPQAERHAGLLQSGLFSTRTYLELNPDLDVGEHGAFTHLLRRGLREGRRFTTAESIARQLARRAPELAAAQTAAREAAAQALAGQGAEPYAAWLRNKAASIGVFCNTQGNFFMQDIAVLLADGLRQCGLTTALRDEHASRTERFDLRVFVAPHEFFYLGKGIGWQDVAGAASSVLYNVEQPQTQWFCRGFPMLLKAPLLLDINFQTAALLRAAGFPAVHFMPGYMPTAPSAAPIEDVSDVELVQGYSFARQRHNWLRNDQLDARPIDILFIGAAAPRRDRALARLLDLTDDYRFLCVYRNPTAPLTAREETATSARINRALGQRSKIVLNIYRDWIGYFDFSRNVQYGFWQGAAVVTDPGLPHPLFQPGVHFLQESTRHLGELVRWLLATPDGRRTLDSTRHAAFAQASGLGSMPVALAPVLAAFQALLQSGPR
jgi:hypothetical protein